MACRVDPGDGSLAAETWMSNVSALDGYYGPTGFLYSVAASPQPPGALGGWSIEPDTGEPMALPGSPYPASTGSFGLAFDGAGHAWATSSQLSPTQQTLLHRYTLEADGSLEEVAGGPMVLPAACGRPVFHAPTRTLYLSLGGGQGMMAWRVDPATGSLTPVRGFPLPFPRQASLAFDPSGQVLYGADFDRSLHAWTLGPDGFLFQVPGSPFPATVQNPNQLRTVSF